MKLLLSASSPDGSLAAIKAPSNASSSRHLIRIYRVGESTTTLQSTLNHVSELPLVKLVFLGTSSLLGLFGRQEVVLWDLDRGVVAATLSASDDQNFLALATASDDDDDESKNKYYVLVNHGPKLVVQEYLSLNNRLVRKIKSGRINSSEEDDGEVDMNNAAASLVVTSSHVIVRAKGCGVRVMNKNTGKKTGKISLKEATSSFGEASSIEMNSCIGNSNVVVTLENMKDTVLLDLNSCKEIARVSTDTMTPQQAHLQLVAQQTSNDSFILSHSDSLYSVDIGKNKSSSYKKLTQVSTNDPVALFLKSNKLLALIRGRASDYRVQWIDFSKDNEDKLPAVYMLDQEQISKEKNNATNTKKRNASEIKVLGPGQAGSENTASVKKLKANNNHDDVMDASDHDEDDGNNSDNDDATKNLTIAERLQMLTDALDEEENDEEIGNGHEGVKAAIAAAVGKTKFKPQKATTESLKELLTQALQSSDDSLLELALSVHDVKIIATSIKEMHEDLLVILLGKLTSRLASSPLRAEVLAVWISNCLKRGSFDSDHLAVLRNMLYERIESFSDLLRLEGRLSMMVD